MMKKKICTLMVLLGLGIFSAGTIACADDAGTEVKAETETEAAAEAGTENESETGAAETLEYKSLGYTLKNTDRWDGVKGTIFIFPASTTSILENPDLYLATIYYIPASEEDLENEEDEDESSIDKMTVPGVIFSINGDRDQLLEAMDYLGFMDEVSEDELETDLVQVGEADGYEFFLLTSLEDDYAAGLDAEFAEDYRNLPAEIEKELKEAKFYAPVDPMKSLPGIVLSFTTTDLDGNTVTSEELFKDNEITMVNAWGTWCGNCVNEMEELAAIHSRLKEKGCGVIGIEYEETPDEETYQKARDLMKEKGTNYPNVLMPDDNEILNLISGFPTTLFVDREGKILTNPIVGAKVDKYEPTVEALLNGSTDTPKTENAEARTYTYRVLVKDEAGQPLQEVAVQFCDESSCRYGETDEQGCAVFEVPEEKSYDVHIFEAADEYEYDPEEIIKTDAVCSDTTIVLKKAK
jgi:thiol-disulfide isomerase/thioredoxin